MLRHLSTRPSGSTRRHARIGIVLAVVVVGSGLGAWVASPLYNLSAEGLGRSSSAESWSRVASTQCFGTDAPADSRKGLGWLAVLAIPVACCVGLLLVVAPVATGVAAWGGLGAGAAVAVAAALLAVVRRRRAGVCGAPMCESPTDWLADDQGPKGGVGA